MSYNSLAPTLNYIGSRLRIKFDGRCLKQAQIACTHKEVMNIYIAYEINLWTYTQGADLTLGNSLCRTAKLTKNTDKYILTNISILDMVLDLMHAEVFRYLMVVGLVKT